MAISEGRFLEVEKRKAAFKYVFNQLHTSATLDPEGEIFETGQLIYAEDIINGSVARNTNPAITNENTVFPARIRTWVTGSANTGNPYDDIWAGSFSESIYDTSGANPNVEKVIMPLIKLQFNNNQMYFAYGPDDYTTEFADEFGTYSGTDPGTGADRSEYDRAIISGDAFANDSKRLKKWINPSRFGSGYRVFIVLGGNPDATTGGVKGFPNNSQPLSEGGNNFAGNSYGGWLWDYSQGALYIGADEDAKPTNDSPSVDTTGDDTSNTENVDISSKQHPLWVIGYRYIGPTGSVALATTASFALNAGNAESADSADSAAAGTAGATPVLTDITSPNSIDYDWYTNNVMLPTDNADIYEYKSDENFLKISASIGDPNLLIRMGSTSFADITYTAGTGYETNAQINDGNIFLFDNSGPTSYPALSSYGTFITPEYPSPDAFNAIGSDPNSIFMPWTTHSFAFTSPKLLSQIELYYSADNNSGPTTYYNPVTNTSLSEYPDDALNHIDGYELYGSVATDSGYVLIASASNLRGQAWISGSVPGTSYIPGNNYMPELDGQVTSEKYISKATSSLITDATKYQYYRLYVSGGGLQPAAYDRGRVVAQTLHHVDIIENKYLITNRKQIDFARNTDLTNQVAFQGGLLTEFDKIVSMSAAKLGLVSMSEAGLTVFKGGEIDRTLFGVSPINEPLPNLQSFGQFTGSSILASGDITSSGIYALGNSTLSELSADNITINESLTMNQNASLAIGSLQSLYFTNKKQDGTTGTDEYSARIFGHYTDYGVSDIYVDAYRIYNIADTKILLRTLHKDGIIDLNATSVHLGNSLTSSLNLSGSLYVNNHSIISASSGTVFIAPNSNVQFKTPITASGNISASGTILTNNIISNGITVNGTSTLSGSLLISGSIIPVTNVDENGDITLTSSFDLGSSAAAWKDIHVSDGTIRFYDGQKEVINMSLDEDKRMQFKSGSEFRTIKAGRLVLTPSGSTTPNVQLSDQTDVGFIAVMSEAGKHATILRAENQSLGPLLGRDYVAGTLTQKGSGSFAILLDADDTNHNLAKFSVESNSAVAGFATRLFSVSESFETRVHEGGLRADKYVTTTDITASIISASSTITANSFIGTFAGALSSSAQIATDISGAFDSFSTRITTVETTIDGGLF
jgi:hypothetical protein